MGLENIQRDGFVLADSESFSIGLERDHYGR